MKASANEILQTACKSINTLIEKAASRKLLVWTIATHMTYIGILDPSLWFTISMVYLGVQGALDWQKSPSNFIQKSEQRQTPTDSDLREPIVSPTATTRPTPSPVSKPPSSYGM